MVLSNELISQFVKATNDATETISETTVYGTIVKVDDGTYVQLDGSELLTPISSTTDVVDGERVTVLIKQHTAIVTGNISSPSARTETVRQIGTEVSGVKDTVTQMVTVIADKVSTEQLEAVKAQIKNLDVDNLTADVADIKTLIFGSASGDTIQTSFSNAVIAQVGSAQIKSAMIESLAASKITSGNIITNNVSVVSEDGRLLIADETIQISDANRVRVQIGKDASNDYSINVWDANGNLMFSEGGITDSAIKNAIIRDDMVSDTANISGHKLNIDSLFEVINGSTKTINSSKVYLDDKNQTLDVVFTSMTSDVNELSEDVSSQGTQLSVIQGKINSKVWQQDIDSSVNEVGEKTEELSTKYSQLSQSVNGLSSTISNLTIGGRNLIRNSVTMVFDKYRFNYDAPSSMSQQTYSQLAAYTHNQLRNEVYN